MKIKTFNTLIIFALTASLFFTSCKKEEEDPTPTNDLMTGVWKVSQIIDESGSNVTDTVTSWFPTFIHMDGVNSVNSTAGPLFMYIVYGKSKFTSITSKIDEVFSYANLQLTEGEWFIDKNKVVDNFTLEIKMRFPTMETLNTIFSLFNIDPPEIVADAIDIVVYHRFKYITVEINDENPNKMVWKFTSRIAADYNTKDKFGDKILYTGVSATGFSKCTITLEKQAKGINELSQEAADNGYGGPRD